MINKHKINIQILILIHRMRIVKGKYSKNVKLNIILRNSRLNIKKKRKKIIIDVLWLDNLKFNKNQRPFSDLDRSLPTKLILVITKEVPTIKEYKHNKTSSPIQAIEELQVMFHVQVLYP